MNLSNNFVQRYFNYIYTPVYDSTTACSERYKLLQSKCISSLHLPEGNQVLCAGIGTGNEIISLFSENPDITITGIDYSETALKRAQYKAKLMGISLDTCVCDVHTIPFEGESFDRVVCIHVMDFVNNPTKVTGELLRILKPGGRFSITFPSQTEGAGMGRDILRDHLKQSGFSMRRVFRVGIQCLLGILYIPLLFRPAKPQFTRESLSSLFDPCNLSEYRIEEEPVYRDFIVSGTK